MKVKLELKLRDFCIAQFTIVTAIVIAGAISYALPKFADVDGWRYFLNLFDVGREQSVPTFVSVVNLLLASIFLFIIYIHEKSNNVQGSAYWGFLCMLFVFLSLDEAIGIHERFGRIHRYLVDEEVISPMIATHEWLPFGVFFVLVNFVILLPFLRHLSKVTLWAFLVAGSVFVTGAVGFEYLGARMLESGAVDSINDWAYLMRRIFEEGFEMYGIAIFNCALYRELLRKNFLLAIGD